MRARRHIDVRTQIGTAPTVSTELSTLLKLLLDLSSTILCDAFTIVPTARKISDGKVSEVFGGRKLARSSGSCLGQSERHDSRYFGAMNAPDIATGIRYCFIIASHGLIR